MLLDDLSEYDQWSIPPDDPIKQASVDLIRKHAATNPKLRNILERLRSRTDSIRIRSLVDHALQKGSPITDTTKQLFKARSDSGKLQEQIEKSQKSCEQLCERLSNLSLERDGMLRQLEELKHQSLLVSSITNNLHYKSARLEAYSEAITTMKRSKPASLQECEQMLNAVQFDLDSDESVNLERILMHRDSVVQAIASIEARDRATINNILRAPEPLDPDAEQLANTITQMKLESLQNMEKHEANQREIARLQADMIEPATDAAESHALRCVHLRLLGILDDLVPQTFDESPAEQPSTANKEVNVEKELKAAYDSIAKLKGTLAQDVPTPPLDTNKLSGLQNEIEASLLLAPKLPQLLRLSIVKAPTQQSTSTDQIMNAAHILHNLQVKMSNTKMKARYANAQTIQAISEAQLRAKMQRKSLESPLLATRDLRDVGDVVPEMSAAWYEESTRRTELKKGECLERCEAVRLRLDRTMGMLEEQKKLYEDVKMLER